jgi:subfamily B ATP-binding cassette protein HlyB/CyaB
MSMSSLAVQTDQIRPDSGLLCLVLIARLLGLRADQEQLRHLFQARSDEPVSATQLVRAAQQLGLKAKSVGSRWQKLATSPLPAIAEQKDGSFIILAKIAGDKALIQHPQERAPRELSQADFLASWSGQIILLTRREVATGARRFDFSWFLPAIHKYRKLLGEVLLASFFLQLLALASPLFFQVVIDKVLVHHGLTTLDVLCFGLLVVGIFEAVLGGLRTYLFSHPPTASMWSWVRCSSATSWPCHCPTSKPAAWGTQSPASESWKTSATSSPARHSRWCLISSSPSSSSR